MLYIKGFVLNIITKLIFLFYSYRLHSQVGGGAIVGVGSRSLGSLYEGSAFLGSSPNNIDNGYSSHRDHNQKPRVTSLIHYHLKLTLSKSSIMIVAIKRACSDLFLISIVFLIPIVNELFHCINSQSYLKLILVIYFHS